MEEKIKTNLFRAGEYFMSSIWIQSQLSDLIILSRNKNIIGEFVTNKEKIPSVLKENRIQFWKMDFKDVKREFENEFNSILSDQNKADLNTIYYIRNGIAHSHVSIARNFLFYVPSQTEIEQKFRLSLNVLNENDTDLNDPAIFKFDFSNDEIYFHNFNAIKRIDEELLFRVCEELKIPHERIR